MADGWDGLTGEVIGAAIEVHRRVGPGLLESVDQHCLAYELAERGLVVEREVTLPIRYKGLTFEHGFRLDLLVENRLVVELKAVDKMIPVYRAQLLSYLKLSQLKVGLIINFNVPRLTEGVTRVVNQL